MREVYKNLFVCNQAEFNTYEFDDTFSYVLAAKSFHKCIAIPDGYEDEGYVGNLDSKNKEYLLAARPDRNLIALNLIDAKDAGYIPDKLIRVALSFVNNELRKGRKVVIVCNKAVSRSPSLAIMYLKKYTSFFDGCDEPSECFARFVEVYPEYAPNNGMLDYTENFLIFG